MRLESRKFNKDDWAKLHGYTYDNRRTRERSEPQTRMDRGHRRGWHSDQDRGDNKGDTAVQNQRATSTQIFGCHQGNTDDELELGVTVEQLYSDYLRFSHLCKRASAVGH